jgi:DNA-binding transcriptional ArsR family regulator
MLLMALSPQKLTADLARGSSQGSRAAPAHGMPEVPVPALGAREAWSREREVAVCFGAFGAIKVMCVERARHPEVLSGELLELVATRMRALSDPQRMRVLLGIEGREVSVQELADELEVSHQSASWHVNVLYRGGLLARRRDGKSALYSLADYTAPKIITQAAAAVSAHLEELSELPGQ